MCRILVYMTKWAGMFWFRFVSSMDFEPIWNACRKEEMFGGDWRGASGHLTEPSREGYTRDQVETVANR